MAKMNSFEKFFVNHRLQYYLHKWFGFGKFLKKLPSMSYQRILEIGAGVGFTSELIADKYPTAQIIATDFDEESVSVAKGTHHLKNVTFRQEDAAMLSFPSAYFDAAFSVLTLHHISNYPSAVGELARVLKPGGALYIMDLSTKSYSFLHLGYIPGVFNKTDIVDLLKEHGFSVKDRGGHYAFYLEAIKS
ncbi:class I SAM-dependent methyltransferase [Candidatus Kaiserbacteria bacterium]|nr:class I SAM-dependent methyltransferase [Candidatus Kaiserbacteria bacterium]